MANANVARSSSALERRKCVVCTADYSPLRRNQKVCSDKCRVEHQARYAQDAWRNRHQRTEVLCKVPGCGNGGQLVKGMCRPHYYRLRNTGTLERKNTANGICSVEGCGVQATRKSLCGKHYQRLISTGTTELRPRINKYTKKPVAILLCLIDGCGKRRRAFGYCAKHADKFKKYGDPLAQHPRLKVGGKRAVEAICQCCGRAVPDDFPMLIACSHRCYYRLKNGRPAQIECVVCKSKFEPIEGAVTCSEQCRRHQKREHYKRSAAKRRATAEGKRAQYENNRRYIAANAEKVREYYRHRRQTDPMAKAAIIARAMLHRLLKRTNQSKRAKCREILGYTPQELKTHIERQFTAGMRWDLVGKQIHIDHIIPVAEFLRRGETRPDVINALPNLRPLWATDNVAKRDRVLTLL